jgi:hypothetical protein
MSPAQRFKLVNSWETVRYELLNTRVCDMGLCIEGSLVEPFVQRLYRELEAKGLNFFPKVYLTNDWGCPDQVPVIGVPFYLADARLARIEEEQTGEIEDRHNIMMLLRHEAGHAFNYAYQFYRDPEWSGVFGPFSRPYVDDFRPNPFSRQFVRHIVHHRYGKTYAQKHPDEDCAETFAVWLTPGSGWRRRYRNWPALRKLQYMDRLMKSLRGRFPRCTRESPLCSPVEEMDLLLASHYGERIERYRAQAQGYVDDKLREVFPEVRGRLLLLAGELLREHREELLKRVTRWSRLDREEVEVILSKLETRADALGLQYRPPLLNTKIMDLTALAMALAKDFAYTGRLTG